VKIIYRAFFTFGVHSFFAFNPNPNPERKVSLKEGFDINDPIRSQFSTTRSSHRNKANNFNKYIIVQKWLLLK